MNARLISISVPPNGPDPIPALAQTHAKLCGRVAELADELHHARKDGLEEALALDIRETADAIAAGKAAKDVGRHETRARANIDRLEHLFAGATVACNEAAMGLSRAVADVDPEWRAQIDKDEEEAAQQFQEALATVREAARKLSAARGTRGYLDRHEAHKPSTYVAPNLLLPERVTDANSKPDVDAVVDALAKVAAEPDVPAGRRFTTTKFGRTVSVKA